MTDDGEGQAQGRQGQKGRPEEGPEEELICTICDRGPDVHDGVDVRHAFTPPGVDVKTSQFDRKKPKQRRKGDDAGGDVSVAQEAPQAIPGMPQVGSIDPVLRYALVENGILTMQQLADAEGMIRAMSGQITRVFQEAENRE